MRKKRVIINRSSRVRRQRDPIPWKYCVLTVVCGLLLVSGFFLAARLHFTTIQMGMGNADLRSRMTKLKDENRKLLLSKERASTPVKIAKLARSYGFTEAPQIMLDAAPSYQNASGGPSTQPVVAYSANKPVIEPPKTGDAEKEGSIKAVTPKRTKKEGISEDQIAVLRTKVE